MEASVFINVVYWTPSFTLFNTSPLITTGIWKTVDAPSHTWTRLSFINRLHFYFRISKFLYRWPSIFFAFYIMRAAVNLRWWRPALPPLPPVQCQRKACWDGVRVQANRFWCSRALKPKGSSLLRRLYLYSYSWLLFCALNYTSPSRARTTTCLSNPSFNNLKRRTD